MACEEEEEERTPHSRDAERPDAKVLQGPGHRGHRPSPPRRAPAPSAGALASAGGLQGPDTVSTPPWPLPTPRTLV
jgi:hypothetical protein